MPPEPPAETPEWLRSGTQVDVLCQSEGLWYCGIVESMGVNGEEVVMVITFAGYEPEQHYLSNCKLNNQYALISYSLALKVSRLYQFLVMLTSYLKILNVFSTVTFLILVHGDIRPHEEDRILKPRIGAKILQVMKKMKKGEKVSIHGLADDCIIANDPMKGQMVLSTGLQKYEHLQLLEQPSKRTCEVSDSEPEKPKKKKAKGTDNTPQATTPTLVATKTATTVHVATTTKKPVDKSKTKKSVDKLASVISIAPGVVRKPDDIESKNNVELRNELKELKQEIANLTKVFKVEIKTLGDKIDNIACTCTCSAERRLSKISIPSFDLGHLGQYEGSSSLNELSFTQMLNGSVGAVEPRTTVTNASTNNPPQQASTYNQQPSISTLPSQPQDQDILTSADTTSTDTSTYIQPLQAPTYNQQSATNTLPPQTQYQYTLITSAATTSTVTSYTQPLQATSYNQQPATNTLPPQAQYQNTLFSSAATSTVTSYNQPLQAITCNQQLVTNTHPPQAQLHQTFPQTEHSVDALANIFHPTWGLVSKRSTSRNHMAWQIVLRLFTTDQLRDRNCRGISNIKGKEKLPLDPAKLDLVQRITFHYYPLLSTDNVVSVWRSCEKSIDSNLRNKFSNKPKTK